MAPQVTALLTDILQPSYIWLLVTGKSSNVIILSARYEAICLCSYSFKVMSRIVFSTDLYCGHGISRRCATFQRHLALN